jgi:hypothetical protein
LDAASRSTTTGGSFKLRAGYCAVPDLAAADIDLTELVHRAESALAKVPTDGQGDSIMGFDELPTA